MPGNFSFFFLQHFSHRGFLRGRRVCLPPYITSSGSDFDCHQLLRASGVFCFFLLRPTSVAVRVQTAVLAYFFFLTREPAKKTYTSTSLETGGKKYNPFPPFFPRPEGENGKRELGLGSNVT